MDDARFDEKPIAEDEIGDWEVVEATPGPRSVVLSVRFNEAEMTRLREEAAKTGASLSDVVRHAVRAYFEPSALPVSTGWSEPNVNVVVRSGLVTFGTGQDFIQQTPRQEQAG